MNKQRSLLIKISGELFSRTGGSSFISHIVEQLSEIAQTAQVGIVIGGGNFFRGNTDGKRLGMCLAAAHEVGMLATLMNGRILQSLLKKNTIPAVLLSAVPCPSIAEPLSSYSISAAMKDKKCIIFAGGTGNPFFTTDTTAFVRALQINAHEVWKATTVDGLYDTDPQGNSDAVLQHQMNIDDVIEKKLKIMDTTALVLAREHAISIRIFNLFTPNSLMSAFTDQNFGSLVH